MPEPMKVSVLHVGDCHLGIKRYGVPTGSGLNSREQEFLATLDRVLARMWECDAVVMPGDIFDQPQPSTALQHAFAERVLRVSREKPLVIIPGNHDVAPTHGANPTDLFTALELPNVHVLRKPDVVHLEWPLSGKQLLVAALPFVPKSRLLTQEQARGLGIAESTALLQQILVGEIERLADEVKRLRDRMAESGASLADTPAILMAHYSVEGCTTGGWTPQTIGGAEVVLPIAAVQNPAFDYVALAHVHKYQALGKSQPPVIYPGSIERCDFGEEDEDRVAVIAEVSRGNTAHEYFDTGAREFMTLELGECTDVLERIDEVLDIQDRTSAPPTVDAVVRVTYSLPEGAPTPSEREIRRKLLEYGAAHVATVKRIVPVQEFRARSNAVLTAASPLDALGAYFDTQGVEPERKERLLGLARAQMEKRSEVVT